MRHHYLVPDRVEKTVLLIMALSVFFLPSAMSIHILSNSRSPEIRGAGMHPRPAPPAKSSNLRKFSPKIRHMTAL